MQRDGRRVLYHPECVRAYRDALAEARADLHAMHHRHLRELAALRRELDECHAALRELRDARAAIVQAEAELVSLYRERSIQRARTAERDPGQPLN
jgi:hypothetical protein